MKFTNESRWKTRAKFLYRMKIGLKCSYGVKIGVEFLYGLKTTPICTPYENFNPIFTPYKNFAPSYPWMNFPPALPREKLLLDLNLTRILSLIFTSKSPKFLKIIPESKSVIVSLAGMSKLSLGKVNLPQSWGRFLSSGCSQ